MPDMWKPQPIEVYIHWVNMIIQEAYPELNNWEKGFISSVENYLRRGIQLTQPQAEKLESIYAEKTK